MIKLNVNSEQSFVVSMGYSAVSGSTKNSSVMSEPIDINSDISAIVAQGGPWWARGADVGLVAFSLFQPATSPLCLDLCDVYASSACGWPSCQLSLYSSPELSAMH